MYHISLVGQYVKKADLGTRTTTISVGTRKYGKIRAPVPSADTGTGIQQLHIRKDNTVHQTVSSKVIIKSVTNHRSYTRLLQTL